VNARVKLGLTLKILTALSGLNFYLVLLTGGYCLSFGLFEFRSHSLIKAFLLFLFLLMIYLVYSFPDLLERALSFLRNRWRQLALGVIIVIGLLLRLAGIDHGLPHFIPLDETVMGRIIWDMVKTGALNHRFLSYPALFYWVQLPFYIGYFLVGAFLGKWGSLSQVDLHLLYIVGRVVTALISTATIYVGYLLGKEAYNRVVGLSAALFLCFFQYNVRVAKFMRVDVLQTFFLTLALVYLVSMVKGRGKGAYFMAALFSGLAISSKYPSFIIIPVFILAYLLTPKEKRIKGKLFILSLILIPCFSLVTNPFAFLDISRFLNEFAWVGGFVSHKGASFLLPKSGLYGEFFLYAVGIPLSLMVIFGFVIFLVRRQRVGLTLFSFAFLYFIMIASYLKGFPRYMLPILPPAAVAAAYAIFSIFPWLKFNYIKRRRELVAFFIGVLLILPVAVEVSRYSYLLTRKDTFELASFWISENIPEKSGIVGSQFMPELSRGRFRVAKSKGTVFVRPIEDYLREGYQYLVVTSLDLEGRFGKRYRGLLDRFPKVMVFRPEKGKTIGPEIHLLRLIVKPDPRLLSIQPLSDERDTLFIDIGGEGDELYLGEGWSIAEKDKEISFRWSLGKRSSIFFVSRSSFPLRLTIRAKPFTSSEFPRKELKILLNGKPVAGIILEKPRFSQFSIFLSEEALIKGLNRLSFSYHPVFSPAEIWGTGDDRPLALAFDWIRIKKISLKK
jgi:4-amino-4-deoxy-L-arabinose transferase-like glycosyltransferase